MYKVAICDDDKIFIKVLENKIKQNQKCPKDLIFYSYDSGESFLRNKEIDFDLVILDMKLKNMNGYETAIQLRAKNEKVVIAFCTGVCAPLPEHFDVQPYRYLMKQYNNSKMDQKIGELLDEMKRKKQIKYLDIVSDGKAAKINIDDILYISRLKRGSRVYITEELKKRGMDKQIVTNRKLDDLYEELSGLGFEYPHSSYIVNLKNIMRIENSELTLKNGESLVITRSCKDKFHKCFTEYFGRKYRRGVHKND